MGTIFSLLLSLLTLIRPGTYPFQPIQMSLVSSCTVGIPGFFLALEKSRERYLYIDHRHRGLGSNSCGPQPEKQYELPMGPFAWTFRLTVG